MPYQLTKEGEEYLKEGFPERRLIRDIDEGNSLNNLKKKAYFEIGLMHAKKNGWIIMKGNKPELTDTGKRMIEIEMAGSMAEALSDDLYERYDVENETGLKELWEKDIEEFKTNCGKLGIQEKDIEFIVFEIRRRGMEYLESVRDD